MDDVEVSCVGNAAMGVSVGGVEIDGAGTLEMILGSCLVKRFIKRMRES